MSRRALAATALAGLVACAIQAPPPGGPPDRTPPRLVGVLPDTSAEHPDFRGDAAFLFDEVVSEGGAPNLGLGTGDLEKLVVLSPSPTTPVVRWGRRAIRVRPREGWRPNTTYRVELLPGVVDVRSNRSTAAAVLTFRTGGPIPDYTLRGQLYDWTNGQSLRGAIVEAVPAGDTVGYKTAADSGGRFVLGPIPRGSYLVYGFVDQNRNNRRERREAFDSVRVTNDSGSVGELWTFVHDTVPARLQRAEPVDSTTFALTFTQPVDPAFALAPTLVRVRKLPDSAVVAVTRVATGSVADSLRQSALAERKGAEAAVAPRGLVDRGPAGGAARGSRKPLEARLVVTFAGPAAPGDRFVVDVEGYRSVSGTVGDARAVLVYPERPPARPDVPGKGGVTKPGAPGAPPRDSTATKGAAPSGGAPPAPRPRR